MKEEKRELIPFLENQFTSHPYPVNDFCGQTLFAPKKDLPLSNDTAPPETSSPGFCYNSKQPHPPKSPQIQHRYQTWPYLTYGDTTFFQGPPIILGPSSFQGVFFPQNESIGEVNKNPFGFAPKEQLAAPEIQANASAEAKRLGFFGRGDEHLTEVQCLDMLIRFVEGAEPSKMT